MTIIPHPRAGKRPSFIEIRFQRRRTGHWTRFNPENCKTPASRAREG